MTSSGDVWQLFFDGASKTRSSGKIIAGVGIVFISSENHILPCTFSLTEACFNNLA